MSGVAIADVRWILEGGIDDENVMMFSALFTGVIEWDLFWGIKKMYGNFEGICPSTCIVCFFGYVMTP